jgi:hypothetical protein
MVASLAANALSKAGVKNQQAGKEWLSQNRASLPAAVAEALEAATNLAEEIRALEPKRRGLLRQLRRALGIIPSSERRGGSAQKPKDADEPRGSKRKPIDAMDRLRQIEERAKELACWHRRCARRQDCKSKGAKKKRMKLEEFEFSPEEEAELEKEEAASIARRKLGGGADPRFAPHAEMLMHGASSTPRKTSISCDVDPLDLPKDSKIKQKFYESRERLDFSFSLTVLDVSVEKLAVETPRGTTLITGDMETIGPAKMRVTWGFLASMAILVSQYVMPFNRFGRLVSSQRKAFSSAEISRYFQFVASHFAPIYVHLGRALAQAPVLAGDDTSALVLEVSTALSESELEPDTPLPWAPFATADAARAQLAAGAAPTMSLTLAEAFGFAWPRKDGKGGKRAFNTTTLSGRMDADDPKSTVVFYRSHLGGMGNLLDAILPHRHPENRDLVVQSDLSTVNLISDPVVLRRLNVALAGCAAHARRPFALHEHDDPDACERLLHRFKGIPIYEGTIDAHGRNEINTLAVRGSDERQQWDAIREICTELTAKWSRQTPLGEGARYVLRHFDKLTYYLGDARVSPWNNFSERMLRLEKLIARNSLFRQSLEGRFSLDVMRTVLQTAIAAEVDLTAYVMWVMRMPKDAVAADPGEYTPQAFSRWWNEQSAAVAEEDRQAAAS